MSVLQTERSVQRQFQNVWEPSASPDAVVTVAVLALSMYLACSKKNPGQACGYVNLSYPNAECLKYQLKPASDVGAIQQTEENCSNKFQNYWGDRNLI